jgi:hypothetical protein
MVALVGRVSRTAVLVWSLVGLGGCSAIAGLDSINEQSCAPNCGDDSGPNRDLDSPSGDTTTNDTGSSSGSGGGDSSPADDSSQGNPDTGSGSGSGGDSSTVDDTGVADAHVNDSGQVVDAPPVDDAPFDAGCGDLNSTSNCGACGIKCGSTAKSQSTQNASQCCTGTTCPGSTNGAGDSCQYTCTAGNFDCNAINPPNTDGCECSYAGVTNAPSCCADACPTKHDDGLVGQSYYPASPYFYDCVGTGQMNSQLAQDACNSYVVARGGAADYCQPFTDSADATSPDSWCAATSPTTGFMNDCICWTFSGPYVGQVFDPKAQGASPPADCFSGSSTVTFN